ncbi:MAG: hypothetical protein AAFX06_22510 [Planctomycetota bacterium]
MTQPNRLVAIVLLFSSLSFLGCRTIPRQQFAALLGPPPEPVGFAEPAGPKSTGTKSTGPEVVTVSANLPRREDTSEPKYPLLASTKNAFVGTTKFVAKGFGWLAWKSFTSWLENDDGDPQTNRRNDSHYFGNPQQNQGNW